MNSEALSQDFRDTRESLRSRQGGATTLSNSGHGNPPHTVRQRSYRSFVVFVKFVCGHTVETVPIPIYDRCDHLLISKTSSPSQGVSQFESCDRAAECKRKFSGRFGSSTTPLSGAHLSTPQLKNKHLRFFIFVIICHYDRLHT